MIRRPGLVAGTLILASLASTQRTAAEAPAPSAPAPSSPAPPPAASRPVVVDRVIAVVGTRALLLSELRARAASPLAALDKANLPRERREKAERDLANELVQRMIDAELVVQAADRARIQVTSQEIEHALGVVATQNKLTVAGLMVEVQKHGYTEGGYREEIGRQIREAKMLRMRPLPKGIKLAELDGRRQTEVLEKARKEWLTELRRATYVEIRLGP